MMTISPKVAKAAKEIVKSKKSNAESKEIAKDVLKRPVKKKDVSIMERRKEMAKKKSHF